VTIGLLGFSVMGGSKKRQQASATRLGGRLCEAGTRGGGQILVGNVAKRGGGRARTGGKKRDSKQRKKGAKENAIWGSIHIYQWGRNTSENVRRKIEKEILIEQMT